MSSQVPIDDGFKSRVAPLIEAIIKKAKVTGKMDVKENKHPECRCNYPRAKYPTDSLHREDCPLHIRMLERHGLKKGE